MDLTLKSGLDVDVDFFVHKMMIYHWGIMWKSRFKYECMEIILRKILSLNIYHLNKHIIS